MTLLGEELLMNNLRVLSVLTLVNLGILGFILLRQIRPVEASSRAANSVAEVIRARGFEIVDAQGQVRASIQIVPEGPARMADGSVAKDGKIYPETVLFRLIRRDSRPSVKISTSEQGSALTLSGGIDPTYIVLSSDGGSPSLSLTDKDGRQQLVKP
jgi:hypothetical protein